MSSSPKSHHHHHHHHHDDAKKGDEDHHHPQPEAETQNVVTTPPSPSPHPFGLVVGASLHQCAESHVYDATFCGQPAIVKIRIKKEYRHQVLDERIRNQRMQREGRALARAAKNGVPVPAVYFYDKSDCSIVMEKIIGCTVREVLNTTCSVFGYNNNNNNNNNNNLLPPCTSQDDELKASCASPSKILVKSEEIDESFFFPPTAISYASPAHAVAQIINSRILWQMGRIIAKLHSINAMHGDLTTSNFMVRGMNIAKLTEIIAAGISSSNNNKKEQEEQSFVQKLEDLISCCEVVIIDFGLVQESSALEERAVDLYVLERAIVSTHPTLQNAGQVVIDGYCAQVRQLELQLEKEVAKARENGTGLGGRPTKQSANAAAVMDRLETVRARGRKRSMLG